MSKLEWRKRSGADGIETTAAASVRVTFFPHVMDFKSLPYELRCEFPLEILGVVNLGQIHADFSKEYMQILH